MADKETLEFRRKCCICSTYLYGSSLEVVRSHYEKEIFLRNGKPTILTQLHLPIYCTILANQRKVYVYYL